MPTALYYFVIPAIAYLLVTVPLRLWKHRYAIRNIRGPPRPSFLLGLLRLTPSSKFYCFILNDVYKVMNTSFAVVSM